MIINFSISKEYNKLIITIICLICYLNTLNGSFVFDDAEAVVKNTDLDAATPLSNILKNDFWGTNISSNTSHKSYRPVTIFIYKLLVILVGAKEPIWFHFVNIILYILVCLAFYRFLELIFNADIACPTAILFSTHPVHTEVVASVVGCADLLCSLFFFLALIHYHKTVIFCSVWNYILALICTTIATFSKEIGITALGIFLLMDLFLYHKTKTFFRNKSLMLRSLGIIFTGLIVFYLRCKAMNFTQPKFQPADNPASFAGNKLIRFFTYSYIYAINMILLIWPQWLCFDWSMGCISLIEDIFDLRLLNVIFLWVMGSFIVYKAIKYHQITCLSLIMIIVPFLPASNLLFRVGFVIAERVLFLPSAGFCLLVVNGWYKLCLNIPACKKIMTLGFCILIFLFTLKCQERSRQWLNEEELFKSALDICPRNAKVHYNVAKVEQDKGNLKYAESEYRIAIKLNPTYDQAMNNLANLLRDQGELDEAQHLLKKAIDIRPEFATAWMNLGIILATKGNDSEAEICYKSALAHRRKYPDCYYNLGNLYIKQSKQQLALDMWAQAIKLKPCHLAAWSNMLVLLDTLERYDEVTEKSSIALKTCPPSPAIHFTLANTLGKLKRWTEAEKHFKEAVKLNPRNALYYSNFGVLYHRWGKMDLARQMYEEALLLNPSMNTTVYNLRKITKSM